MVAAVEHLVLVDIESTRSPEAVVATFRYVQGGLMHRGRLWLCPHLRVVGPPQTLYAQALAALDALDADSAFLTEQLRA